ncbi:MULTISPECIES: glutathione S-transferase family protein [Oligella]|uniref:glutathione S-transferase family protein n=1 Tax=Oligella TaxID=90243 RepID=UPI0006616248|nr:MULTISPECIES: glutathione S-transferase N-terminal domain-containing protein [Oligella]OFV51202.1 glutathione S-transferase [Oligella sp. HMSC09E12]
MKLYYLQGSCSVVPHTALYWLGVDFEAYQTPRDYLKSPEYLAKNPAGSVPTLEDGDFTITQNIAILTYLDGKFPDAELFGAKNNLQQRALAYRWLAYANSDIHKQFVPFFSTPGFIDGDQALHERVNKAAEQSLIKSYKIADEHLANREYLIDQICIADIYLFVTLRWAKLVKLDLSQLENLQAYYERVAQFEPLQKALQAEGIRA